MDALAEILDSFKRGNEGILPAVDAGEVVGYVKSIEDSEASHPPFPLLFLDDEDYSRLLNE